MLIWLVPIALVGIGFIIFLTALVRRRGTRVDLLRQTWAGSSGADIELTPAVEKFRSHIVPLTDGIDAALAQGDANAAESGCEGLAAYLNMEASANIDDQVNLLIGIGFSDLGIDYRELGKRQEAETALKRAIEHLSRLVDQGRCVGRARSTIASSKNHLGLIYLEHGPKEMAAQFFDEAIALRRSITEDRPDDQENKIYLAGAICNRGALALSLQDRVTAHAFFSESIGLIENTIPACSCGCRDAVAQAVSAAMKHPHWILTGHQFRRNAEAGLASCSSPPSG